MADLFFKENGEKKVVYKTPIFDVIEQEKLTPDNKEFKGVTVKAPDWVSAVVFAYGKYILVRQFRHGANKVLIEFPCGQVEENETPLQAVLRECREEIGLKEEDVISIKKLWEANPNPAFMENKMICYYIEADRLSEKQRLDDNEFLDIDYYSKEEVDKIIKAPKTSAMMKLAWASTLQNS